MWEANRRVLWLIPAGLLAVGGVYYVGLSLNYLWRYWAAVPSPYRGENLAGSMISLAIALPFWLLVSAFAFPARGVVSHRMYVALNLPAIVLGAGFILVNLIPMAGFLLGW